MTWLLKKLDWMNKWLAPVSSGLAALFGLLWEKDFATFVFQIFPQRTGLHLLLQEYMPFAFISCFIMGGVFSSFRIFTQKTIGQLETDLSDEREKVDLIASNIETLVNGWLLRLSEKIGFQRDESSRLTIYIHNNNGHFISFGRYASDPSHSSKGRNLLPDSIGCIAHAWKTDWCYEGNLTYKTARQKYHLTKDIYEGMHMKSKFYAVKRIVTSGNKKPVAVLVFESLKQDRFPEDQIKKTLDNEEAYLSEIIHCLKEHIPNPQDAMARGF